MKASQDADGETDPAVTLTHAASGGGYNITDGSVTVTILEDDAGKKGLTITPSALTVPEGSADSYTVVLNTQPTRSVTVTLNRSDAAGSMSRQSVMVNPMTLTFAPQNWNVPQRVTVRAHEDDNGVSEIVTLTHLLKGRWLQLHGRSHE